MRANALLWEGGGPDPRGRPGWEPPEAKLCRAGRGGRLSLLRSFPVRSPGSLGFAKSRNSCQRTGLASVDAPRLRVGEVCWFYGPRVWSGVLKLPWKDKT